jgi:low affinity Fe/Cu permease
MPDQNDKNRQPAFDRFATLAARWMGQGVIFAIAALFTLGSAVSGPIFHFSNAWQLIINMTTTVLTFLMVFLIQNTLNRDSAAIHVKLDELVHVTAQARDQLIGVEHLGDEELEGIRQAERTTRVPRARTTRVPRVVGPISEELSRGAGAPTGPDLDRGARPG